MNRNVCLLFALAISVAAVPGARQARAADGAGQQQSDRSGFQFGSSPNPVGSGARALGIASAFIATADDATAASWNPGGLIALEKPEASVVLSYKRRNEEFTGIGIDPADEVQTFAYPGVNYFSVAYPFKIGSRFFVAALNYQALIDFETRIKRTFLTSGEVSQSRHVDFEQLGSLRALTPALAFQISAHVAVGLAINVSTDRLGMQNGWNQRETITRTTVIGTNTINDVFDSREELGFNGIGANAGVLWDITPRWTLGAVLKTPIAGDLTRTVTRYDLNGGSLLTDGAEAEFEDAFRLPPSFGVGLAYRHSDELTVSADVYRTEWRWFRHKRSETRRNVDEQGNDLAEATITRVAYHPITGDRYGNSSVPGTTQVHIGAEKLFVFPRTVVPVRGGIFYDPEPAEDRNAHFLGAALGTGISIGDVIIDAAYQFRFSVGEESQPIRPSQDANIKTTGTEGGAIWQHLFYVSTICHF